MSQTKQAFLDTSIRPTRTASRGSGRVQPRKPRSASDDGRLVMVSNRIQRREDASCGRLAKALRSVLGMHGGLWFGWSGTIATTPILDTRPDPHADFECAAFDFDPSDHEAFYNGFHAHTMNALLHSRLHDMQYDREEMTAWFRINARLAALLKTQLRPNDRIWINGLHLLPMASQLRALGVSNRIGVLLHDAVPASSVLASLPHHDEVFRGFEACDLVGVQTAHDLRVLRDYLIACHGAVPHGTDGLRVGDRAVQMATFPIGIDVERMADLAQRASERDIYRRCRDKLGSHKLLIGVDRPDPANGLCQRLHAIDHLLQQTPRTAGSFSMLQISPPVRYDMPRCVALDDAISRHISDVNGRHGGADWTPVRYIKRQLCEPALAGYLRIAAVGLMTPLSDGMTLAAQEYVACQNPSDPGVLVLSRFAGAADELTDAVQVNPLDVGDMAAGIRTAMRMPLDERRARWNALMSVLRSRDLARWSGHYLSALSRAGARDAAMPTSRTA